MFYAFFLFYVKLIGIVYFVSTWWLDYVYMCMLRKSTIRCHSYPEKNCIYIIYTYVSLV